MSTASDGVGTRPRSQFAVLLHAPPLGLIQVIAPDPIVNGSLVALTNPEALATRVYPSPAADTCTVDQVATPLTAATVTVPVSVALPGLAPSASVTLPANVVRFPKASIAVACSAGVSVPPGVPPAGCTVKTSAAATAGAIVNPVVVA